MYVCGSIDLESTMGLAMQDNNFYFDCYQCFLYFVKEIKRYAIINGYILIICYNPFYLQIHFNDYLIAEKRDCGSLTVQII